VKVAAPTSLLDASNRVLEDRQHERPRAGRVGIPARTLGYLRRQDRWRLANGHLDLAGHRSLLLPDSSMCHLSSILRFPIAQDVCEEGHQSSERGDVSDSPGDDVLDPPEHASRRKRVRVEVQDERPIGW